MKNLSLRYFFVLFVLLFVVAGCGSGNNDDAGDAAAPTLAAAATVPADNNSSVSEPAAIPTPVDTVPAPIEEPDSNAPVENDDADDTTSTAVPLLALNATNSYGEPTTVSGYRMTLAFDSTVTQADGKQQMSSIVVEGERDIVGNKATYTATASGAADFGAGQSFTFTEVDDRTYMILPNGSCATFSETGPGSDLYGVFLNEGGFLGELDGATVGMPPTEQVNGVNTTHYVFNETHLNPIDPTSNEISSVEGHIYVAQDSDYVVRVVMDGIGQSTLANDSTEAAEIHYELNYFDFDVPVNIIIPDGCDDVTETEYPILDDAFAVNAMAGVYTYQSNVDVATAVQFYKTEMDSDGWSLTQEFAVPGGMMLSFSKDSNNVQITINEEGTGVLIGILSMP